MPKLGGKHSEQTKMKMSENKKNNKNAEKWTEPMVEKLLDQAYDIVKSSQKFHFIAQVCDEMEITNTKLLQLVDRFPDLKDKYEQIKQRCLRNCYEIACESKTPSALLLNLKSNHGMTDRITTDNTTKIEGFNIKDLFGFEDDDEE